MDFDNKGKCYDIPPAATTEMWSTTRLNQSHCDSLLPSDAAVDVRHRQSLCSAHNASSSVLRLPSSFSDSSVCASADNDPRGVAAKIRHLQHPLIPHHRRHHQHQQQQQQQQVARETVEERRATALLDVSQCQTADRSICLPWRQTSPLPIHQLLTVYRSHVWSRIVASLLGTERPTASALAAAPPASALVVGVHESSARRPPVPESQPDRGRTLEASDHRGTETGGTAGDTGPRTRLVNWLLDSPNSLPASASSKTDDRNSTSVLEAEARQLLLEQTVLKMRGYSQLCTNGRELTEFGLQRGLQVPGCIGVHGGGGTVGGDVLSCRLCCKRYAKPGAMKMHARTHTLPCRCAVCGKAFSRPWLLQGHLRTHTGERPFQCSQCLRAFADRSNLRAHLQTHAAVKKYACSRCAKTFSRMSLLVKHREGTACPGRTAQF